MLVPAAEERGENMARLDRLTIEIDRLEQTQRAQLHGASLLNWQVRAGCQRGSDMCSFIWAQTSWSLRWPETLSTKSRARARVCVYKMVAARTAATAMAVGREKVA